MLADHNQAVTLLNLGLGNLENTNYCLNVCILIYKCTGIDVDQFAEDEEYRRSIITSLARLGSFI